MSITADTFDCEGDRLVGLLHEGAVDATRAALIVVGGPQYRVGSHRHFYDLAQAIATAGFPTLRFDYRGMGDSDGEFLGFEHIDADIAAAVDHLVTSVPTVREVALIGLCDAASAILMYAWRDPRVVGVVIMNPWMRSEATHARATVRHYYAQRLLSRDLWKKVLGGRFAWRQSLGSLFSLLRRLRPSSAPDSGSGADDRPYPARMLDGIERFTGQTLLITSREDLTAREFEDAAAASARWRRALARPTVKRRSLADASHTFASAAWRAQVNEWITDWLRTS